MRAARSTERAGAKQLARDGRGLNGSQHALALWQLIEMNVLNCDTSPRSEVVCSEACLDRHDVACRRERVYAVRRDERPLGRSIAHLASHDESTHHNKLQVPMVDPSREFALHNMSHS